MEMVGCLLRCSGCGCGFGCRCQTNRHIRECEELKERMQTLEAEVAVAQNKQFAAIKKEAGRCCKELATDINTQVRL